MATLGKTAVAEPLAWPHYRAANAGSDTVTRRETEVLQQVIKGYANKQIAAALYISEDTVKTHLKTIFAKFGVHDRTSAVIHALRLGIVGLGEDVSAKQSRSFIRVDQRC
ncbi:MAG: hypothetical protein RL380_517 [Verrucomicrobiota bacterium]